MPRPRSVSDADIFAATGRAVSRLGPVKLTLAEVAAQAGVSAATLVQRFGSKRSLLLAFVSQGSGESFATMAEIRAAHRSPLAALGAVADCMAGLATSPEVLANNLAFLQIDLVDPEFHKLALAQARSTRTDIKALLDDAIAARELRPCDTADLSRAVVATLNGSLLQWAIEREGTVRERLRRDLDTLLAPRRRRERRSRRQRERR